MQTRVENIARTEVDKVQHEINDPAPEKQEDVEHKENKKRTSQEAHQGKPQDAEQDEEEKEHVTINATTFA